MNWDKSGTLVMLNSAVTPNNQDKLDGISIFLPNKIYNQGTVFLGTPLGHPLFIHLHLMNIADKFDE
jgi:hypothetical protein